MTFGRTNLELATEWLTLCLPKDPGQIESFARSAVASGLPLDISRGKTVWGPLVENAQNVVVGFGSSDFSTARSRTNACDLVSAQIVEFLSCLHGRSLTLFFLPVRQALETYQWDGAIEALETARQDRLVHFTGLSCEGSAMVAMFDWQFRDAFDAICVTNIENHEALLPLAQERRVGMVTTYQSVHQDACRLHCVGSAADVEEFCGLMNTGVRMG